MEYTKDIVLNINYGQAGGKHKQKSNFFSRIFKVVSKNKIFTTILSIAIILIALDCMLISSFVQVLNRI